MTYRESIDKFAELASKFEWSPAGVGRYEICCSFNRESIDPDLVTDDIIEQFGNKVQSPIFGEIYALTVGNYLYMICSEDFENKRKIDWHILLKRASWDNIVLADGETVAFK